jgi:predicted nucleotidyltransferase
VIDCIVQIILAWAQTEAKVRAVALVGSHARGTARADSDLDLVVLSNAPEFFRADASWLDAIEWNDVGTCPVKWQDEDYGVLWSRRLWLEQVRFEVETGFAGPSWAEVNPLDPGTQRVVADGCRILYDPDQSLARLCAAVVGRPRCGAE